MGGIRRDQRHADGSITRLQHHLAERVDNDIVVVLNRSDLSDAHFYIFGFEDEEGKWHHWKIPVDTLIEKGYFQEEKQLLLYK